MDEQMWQTYQRQLLAVPKLAGELIHNSEREETEQLTQIFGPGESKCHHIKHDTGQVQSQSLQNEI